MSAVPSILASGEVKIPVANVRLEGDLGVPDGAAGIVLFAHGSGSSRHSPRNKHVAQVIRGGGFGTLLFDLLTRDEESVAIHTRHLRFDIPLLAYRLAEATRWLEGTTVAELPVGYFGTSTGGGAACGSCGTRPGGCGGRFERRQTGPGRQRAAEGDGTHAFDRG